MRRIQLRRYAIAAGENDDQGRFGEIVIDPLAKFYTGECPDRNNDSGLSCVIPDIYLMIFGTSPHHPEGRFFLEDKHGRGACMMHPGNFCGDKIKGYLTNVEGCILLGNSLGVLKRKEDDRVQKAVLESKPAVLRFEEFMNKETFELEIIQL